MAWAIFVESRTTRTAFGCGQRAFINGLAKNHGGGGHALASGAGAKDQAEIDQVIHELDELVANAKGENE